MSRTADPVKRTARMEAKLTKFVKRIEKALESADFKSNPAVSDFLIEASRDLARARVVLTPATENQADSVPQS